MENINRVLRESARSNGLCDQWYEEWENNCTLEDLAEKMYKGLDFCLKLHWPSNDFIKKNFSTDFLRSVNVFVDDKRSVLNPKRGLILGSSELTIRYNSNNHGEIHVRDLSSVKLFARNRSFVLVHLYEEAVVKAEQYDSARLVLIKHSHDVTIESNGVVIIKEDYDFLK